MKTSPILNPRTRSESLPRIICLRHDPVEIPSPVVDTAAINIHTGSHHFYTPQSGWFNTEDDTQFCRTIDRYITVKTGSASVWGALDYIEEKMEETGAEQYVFNGGAS